MSPLIPPLLLTSRFPSASLSASTLDFAGSHAIGHPTDGPAGSAPKRRPRVGVNFGLPGFADRGPCYTPRLTAATGRSSASKATSECGTVQAAQARRRERRPRAETAGARYRARRAPDLPAAMSDAGPVPNQQVVPRPRSSAGRAGALDSRARPMTETTNPTETTRQPADLPKAYRPSEFEAAIYDRWLAADVFAPDGAGSRADPSLPPFTIIQPPPNITGSLHIGHAQRTTVEDLMVRHARMQGRPTLFLPGLDHASIAAQVVLDRIIAKDGDSRASLGRERYLERMHAFVAQTREVMLGQQRRVGGSFDWDRLRYTMDDGSAKAVREAFTRLYRDGLAYRAEGLINWCPGCRTSVSDLEVIPHAETGTLWSVRYHLIDETTGLPDGDATITVATTRPETILGDTAVAVHPDDDRYRALVGRRVRIPFVERDVPIVADAVVERAFGTGAVKITPGHDRDDYETGRRHGL